MESRDKLCPLSVTEIKHKIDRKELTALELLHFYQGQVKVFKLYCIELQQQ